MQNKSQRIRITESGWKGYTGNFGGIEFVDGISIEAVDPAQMTRLGSLVSIEMVDTKEQAGVAANIARSNATKAAVVAATEITEKKAEQNEGASEEPKLGHTREQLEEIADKNGIAGLRVVAEPLGLKGTSIGKLIDDILKAQAA